MSVKNVDSPPVGKYIENPKTKGSGIVGAIPQTGICPNKCPDCFFQSGRSYLEPLEENLPNMPEPNDFTIVRVNDGNDSSNQIELVIDSCKQYKHKFYNTSALGFIDRFDAPVVLTVNPGSMTDRDFYTLDPIPQNLMFVRIRANTWNKQKVVEPAVEYYTSRDVPIVLTFMAYYNTKILKEHEIFYDYKKRTLNSYYAINSTGWMMFESAFLSNPLVFTCGKGPDIHACKYCGNCVREYFNTITKLQSVKKKPKFP